MPLPLPQFCVYHSGADPVHRSSRLEIRRVIIQSLTHTDEKGRRYYSMSPYGVRRELRTDMDFYLLNDAIDRLENNSKIVLDTESVLGYSDNQAMVTRSQFGNTERKPAGNTIPMDQRHDPAG